MYMGLAALQQHAQKAKHKWMAGAVLTTGEGGQDGKKQTVVEKFFSKATEISASHGV